MKYKYEDMLPSEFIESVEKMPVFLIPTGLLEWHSDHLPLGLDALKAHGICCEIAKKLGGGIVLPPNYIGRPGFSSYAGTLTYSESVVNGIFYEMFYQLKKVGAKVIVLITGHYGPLQVDCIKRVSECFQTENPDISIISAPEYEGVDFDGEIPADHAGKWETSMLMYLYPELVDMNKLKMIPDKMKIYPNPPNDYYKEDEEWKWSNDVFNSSSELGEKAIEAISNHFVEIIKTKLGGKRD